MARSAARLSRRARAKAVTALHSSGEERRARCSVSAKDEECGARLRISATVTGWVRARVHRYMCACMCSERLGEGRRACILLKCTCLLITTGFVSALSAALLSSSAHGYCAPTMRAREVGGVV